MRVLIGCCLQSDGVTNSRLQAIPASYPVDGKDMSPVLTGTANASQHTVFLHYCGFNIPAARVYGRFKVFWYY